MSGPDAAQAVLDWSTAFLRLSMFDFNRYARTSGLSLVQITALMHLYYRGPREVTAFCDLVQVSPAGASQMVERLAQQGLVQRLEAPGDRRIRLVDLTGRGRSIVEEGIQARGQWVEQLLAPLSDEERAGIGQALRTLTEQALRVETEARAGQCDGHSAKRIRRGEG